MNTAEIADARLEQLRKLVSHKPGCPRDRVEKIHTRNPQGERVEVVRCMECGNQSVRKGGEGTWSYVV